MLADERVVNEKQLKVTLTTGVIVFLCFNFFNNIFFRLFDYFPVAGRDIFFKITVFYPGFIASLFLMWFFFVKKTGLKVFIYSIIVQLAASNIIIVYMLTANNQFYFTGLVFLILFTINISGLPFKVNLINVILIFSGFILAYLFYLTLDIETFINNVVELFLISAAGLFSNYRNDRCRSLTHKKHK